MSDIEAMQNKLAQSNQIITKLMEDLGLCKDNRIQEPEASNYTTAGMAGLSIGMVILGMVITAGIVFVIYKKKSGSFGVPAQNVEE